MIGNIEKVINNIAEDILSLAHLVIYEQQLAGSALDEDLHYAVEMSGNPIIKLMFNDYVGYLETGRHANTGALPPISELRDWALRKGIPTDNNTLYAIAKAIQMQGIAPRPILSVLEEKIDRSFENHWADDLFDEIIKEISSYFGQV